MARRPDLPVPVGLAAALVPVVALVFFNLVNPLVAVGFAFLGLRMLRGRQGPRRAPIRPARRPTDPEAKESSHVPGTFGPGARRHGCWRSPPVRRSPRSRDGWKCPRPVGSRDDGSAAAVTPAFFSTGDLSPAERGTGRCPRPQLLVKRRGSQQYGSAGPSCWPRGRTRSEA